MTNVERGMVNRASKDVPWQAHVVEAWTDLRANLRQAFSCHQQLHNISVTRINRRD